MKKSEQRDVATSFTVGLFLVIALSGVMMFFHWNDNYVKSLHEILGLAFALVALLHVVYNFASMKRYFKKRVFLFSSALIVIISAVFIANANTGKNPKSTLMNSTINAPIEVVLELLGEDMKSAKVKLEQAGMKVQEGKSLKDLASSNHTSPFKIVAILTK